MKVAQRQGDPEALRLTEGRRLEQTGEAKAVSGVAIISLDGPIFPKANLLTEVSGATSLELFTRDLVAAADDAQINSILLDVDSPGGVVTDIADAADLVRMVAAEKTVVSFVSGIGASAAYWIASAASQVVISQTAMVGSIGVVGTIGVQEQPDSHGVMDYEIVSSNAPYKRPDPRTDDGAQNIREDMDAIEAVFISKVASYRGVTEDHVRSNFGQGGELIGSAAVAAGMADAVGTFEGVLKSLSSQTQFPVVLPPIKPPAIRSVPSCHLTKENL